MIVYRSLAEVQYNKNSVVTIGMFDGVHLAHQTIIRQTIEKSRHLSGRNVVVTFEPHPREVVSKGTKNVAILSTLEDKLQRIEKLGVDVVFIIPFTFEFSRLTFQEFYSKYIVNGVGVSEVVEGFNHQFGRDREGNMSQVLELGKVHGFSVEAIAMMKKQDVVIASSTIRDSLLSGDVVLANEMLGYEYSFTGTVVRGYGRGKQLGYPTANIVLFDKKKLVPQIGIYAVQIEVEGKWYGGMMSIGHNPTFGDAHIRTIEVNIFDFDKDIYDETVTVKTIQRTRNEKKFNSVDELITEIGNDKIAIKKILDHYKQISS
ncbi:MAG: bifunctional riboflavin kinase/FAD synthetase [Bacteroidota bacterium]|nr:bifunctional riboflavin kinase/FAD synthetase [Bacteroidota bacterium]